jgi:hypothetical protein
LHAQDSQIVRGILRHHTGLARRFIAEPELDALRALDHVAIGDDVATVIHDHSGAQVLDVPAQLVLLLDFDGNNAAARLLNGFDDRGATRILGVCG